MGIIHWAHFSREIIKSALRQKFEKHAPFTHNLLRLAELVNIEMTNEQLELLDKITSFNGSI